MTTSDRRIAWALAAIVFIAAALRLNHAVGVGGYYAPHLEQEEGYYEAGIALLSCRSLAQIPDTTPSSFRAPVYPSFFALVEAFFAVPSPGHARLAQALLSTLAVAAAGLLGWLLFSPWAGLLAAALLAVDAEEILSVGGLNVHGFYGIAMLALGAATVLWLERRDKRRAGLLGLMLAATLLCRPANFPFPLFFAAGCLWLWRFPEGRWRALLPVAAFTALFLAPVAARNGLQFGFFSPFDLKGSYVLLRSTDGPHLRTTVEQALDVAEALEPGFKARALDGRDLHEAMVGLAVRRILESPFTYAGYCLERLYLFWRGLWPFLALAVFALWRRRGDRPLQALVLTAASLSGYAVAGGAEEYRASAVPLLCVVAGAALASLPRVPAGPAPSASARRRLRAGVAVLPGAFVAVYAAMLFFLGRELRDNFRPGPGPEARNLCSDGRALRTLERAVRQAGGRGPAGVLYDNMVGASLGGTADVPAKEVTWNYWVGRAEEEAAAGRRADALRSLAKAEASGPGDYLSRRIVGLYRKLKEERRASALLERMLARDPRDAGLWIDRAELEARSGTRAAALRFLEKAETAEPDAAARRRLAAAYGDLKQFTRAGAHLEPLLKRSPRGAGLWIERAALEVRSGAKAAALKSLDRALEAKPDQNARRRILGLYRELREFRRASGLAAAMLVQDPGDAGLWLETAELEAAAGERAAALAALARAEGANPDMNALRRIMGLYRELGEDRRASALLERQARSRPLDSGLWLERAELQARSGQRDGALESLARAEAAGPGDAERRRVAGLYRELKEHRRAAAVLEELIRRSPDDGALWLERALLETQTGAKEAALRSLARAERLPAAGADPGGEERRRVALAYQSLGEYGRAIAILDALTRRFPAEGMFYGDKGLCEYLSGDAPAAIATLEKAISLSPKFIPAYLTLGAIHSARGRPGEARKVYDAGLARNTETENAPLRGALLSERAALGAKDQGRR
ncbi:MAG: tetratricopeptide repeat protein [Elusimicrobiota bacterium]|nr:tetratricopeptide repeat protein [Elusimicrobiota bacterium]